MVRLARIRIISLCFLLVAGCAHQTTTNDSGGEVELGIQQSSGTMGNNANISSRSINTTSAFLNLGKKIWSFVPFVNLQYNFVSQFTDPAEVGDQNTSGDGYLIGAGLKLDFNSFAVAAGYTFFGSYKLTKKTTANEESVYSSPAGFFAKIDYNVTPKVAVFFVHSNLDYSKQTLGGRDVDITGRSLNHTSYGLGLSYKF
jgi:hypothetical protein